MDKQLIYEAFVAKHVLHLKSISEAIREKGIEKLRSDSYVFVGKYLSGLESVDAMELDEEIFKNGSKLWDRYCKEVQHKASQCDSSVGSSASYSENLDYYGNCGGP
jgi:hypothetical protein